MKFRTCTNVACPVPVRWNGEMWVHQGTDSRTCLVDRLTPPGSQQHEVRPGRAWHCPECGNWISVQGTGEGEVQASCTGTATRPHPVVHWQKPINEVESQAEPVEMSAPLLEVRLSPDRRLVAIRSSYTEWAQWRVSDGSYRTDQRVANWTALAIPGEHVEPQPEETATAGEMPTIEYGIQYQTPKRWHLLPNVIFNDPDEAARAVRLRRTGGGALTERAYRLVQRRAAGEWQPVEDRELVTAQ